MMSVGGIKQGVRVYGIQPEMAFCHHVVMAIYKSHSVPCTVTSAKRDRSGFSLHNHGLACDYRTKHIIGANRRQVIDNITKDLKDALPCCDVIFEYEDEPNEHIHVEFDPKDDPQFQQHKAQAKETGQWPRRR